MKAMQEEKFLEFLTTHVYSIQGTVAQIYNEKFMAYSKEASKRFTELNEIEETDINLNQEDAIVLDKLAKGTLKESGIPKEQLEKIKRYSLILQEVSKKIESGVYNQFLFTEEELLSFFTLTESDLLKLNVKVNDDDIKKFMIDDNKEESVQKSGSKKSKKRVSS